MLERPQMGKFLTDDLMREDWGQRWEGRGCWVLRMLCCHHLPLSAGTQSGSQTHSALLGWEGRSLSSPPLGQLDWSWPSSLGLCFQLIRPGPQGPFLVVWEAV